MLNSWQQIFENQKELPYFEKILVALNSQQKQNIFPSKDNIFKAFDFFELEDTKVVIVGQDPYYLSGYANGLAFAVNNECKTPKSLINIFNEIKNEFGFVKTDKTLISWCRQGVLLLNRVLTVIENKPNSHKNIGWTIFTNEIIKQISDRTNNVVFMLWGNNAQELTSLIGESKHLIIKTSHPSPLGYYRSFKNSNQFKQANDYLQKNNKKVIEW